ncbi:hypothetical protein OY671_012907, partial [Metschnikowia pulcherrima]
RLRASSLENVIAQINHLRTHPSVAAAIPRGEMALHGWFVDIHAGQVSGSDGVTGQFVPMREDQPLPVASPAMAESQTVGRGPFAHIARDFTASIVVFSVAMPLCMGIAIASGVPPEKGSVTGIIGGI